MVTLTKQASATELALKYTKMASRENALSWTMKIMVFVSALPNTLKTYAHIITVGVTTFTVGEIYISERYNSILHGRATIYYTK